MTKNLLTHIYNGVITAYSGRRDLLSAIEAQDVEQVAELHSQLKGWMTKSSYQKVLSASIATDNPSLFNIVKPADPNYMIERSEKDRGEDSTTIYTYGKSLLLTSIEGGHKNIINELTKTAGLNPDISSSVTTCHYDNNVKDGPDNTTDYSSKPGPSCVQIALHAGMTDVSERLKAIKSKAPATPRETYGAR